MSRFLIGLLLGALLFMIGTPASITNAQDSSENSGNSTDPPDLDSLMTKRYLGCEDVSYNVFDLLPTYFYRDEPDSISVLIAYWKDMCGKVEPVLRAEILASIWTNSFSEDIYDESIVDHLLWFQMKTSGVTSDWSSYLWRYPYYPASPMENLETLVVYDEFTADLADQLLPYTEPGSLERLFCHFYRGETDTLFQEIQTEPYRNTKLSQAYAANVANLKNVADLDIALTLGYWNPVGGLDQLGEHSAVGGLVGISDHLLIGRLEGEFRFGKPPDYYRIMHNDDIVFTNHYFGVYLGVAGGLRPLRTRHHALDILAGIGYDGIEVLAASDTEDSKWLNSVNLNVTLGYRLYSGSQSSTQVGLEGRYEKTFHNSDGGSDLSGSAWQIRLVFGWSGDTWRNRRLEALKTDRWER